MKRFLLLLVLASCTNTNVPTITPPDPDPTPVPASGNTAYLEAINTARAVARACGSQNFPAVNALVWNSKLEAAAKAHSDDMRDRNYFAHENPAGPTLEARLKTVGYVWSSYGENIAAGYPSLEAVMTGWLKSPGHCSNIMNKNFTEVGLVVSKGGAYGTYWTMDLGKPR
jgi:uncharacterized protein YkwD